MQFRQKECKLAMAGEGVVIFLSNWLCWYVFLLPCPFHAWAHVGTAHCTATCPQRRGAKFVFDTVPILPCKSVFGHLLV